MKFKHSFFSEKEDPRKMTDEEKTQYRHKKVRKIRQSPEALSDLPIELFLRLVGLFFSIPEEIRRHEDYASTSREFETLRLFIDTQLANDDGDNFAKYEMADYVHNLHMTIVGVIPMDFLESHIYHVREEYRAHVNEQLYKDYLNSKIHQFIDKYCCYNQDDAHFLKIKALYEAKLRHEYRNLVNEIRKAKLAELHIEDTRKFLMKSVIGSYLALTAVPLLILLVYIAFIWYSDTVNEVKLSAFYPEIYTGYLRSAGGIASAHNVAWFNGFIGITLLSLSGVFGATGSLISVLLRIQGVRDNSQLAQNIVAFKYSVNAIKMAPFTGLIFAIILGLLFSGKLIAGALFPTADSWTEILYNNTELAKWLIWCFIAGFSERLVPDMVDRLSAKAKKAEEKP